MTFNEWFLSLEPGRQAVLREDKWMLASAAWDAASQDTKVGELVTKRQAGHITSCLIAQGIGFTVTPEKDRVYIAVAPGNLTVLEQAQQEAQKYIKEG